MLYRNTLTFTYLLSYYLLTYLLTTCVRVCACVYRDGETLNHQSLLFAIELTNVLQTISFSCNFVVYALLNVHFRQAVKDVVCCRRWIADADPSPVNRQPVEMWPIVADSDGRYTPYHRQRRHSDVERQHCRTAL